MIIYKITNTINNKVYIGVTTKTLENRWANHMNRLNRYQKYGVDGYHLYLAMDKYGVDSFKIEEIDRADTLEELFQREIEYIVKYDSYNNGYNSTKGGEIEPMQFEKTAIKHRKVMQSEEVRSKISETMQEYRDNNPFTEETRNKLSEAMRRRYEEGTAPKGVITPEILEAATISKQKKVIVTYGEKIKEFDSIKQSCICLHEKHFNKEVTVKTLQGQATKSIRDSEPYKDVTWKLL